MENEFQTKSTPVLRGTASSSSSFGNSLGNVAIDFQSEKKNSITTNASHLESLEETKQQNFLGLLVLQIFRDRDAKKLFYFVLLLTGVTCLQIFYGSLAGSLGMLSSAFHTSFDVLSMTISLIAMVLAKQPPTKIYSYGYDRLEILSGFTTGIFLLFASLYLVFESVEQILEPSEIDSTHTRRLIIISIVNLIVNVVGAIFFHSVSHTRAESKHAHQENLSSIAVLIAIDAVASVAVIISTYLMSMGLLLADPIICLAIVVLIIYNAIPICKRTGRVLLQTTPMSLQTQLEKALREASTLEGVLECSNEHFWTYAPGYFVGSLSVRVRSDANEQLVLSRVRALFEPLVTNLTIQIEKDEMLNYSQ